MKESHVTPEFIERFWAIVRDELAVQSLDARVRSIREHESCEVDEVIYRSLGGIEICATLCRPIDEGNPKRKYPAIVSSPGYGGWNFLDSPIDCARGYILLQVYPRMQGKSASFLAPDPARGGNWLTYGTENPDTYYYRAAFADLSRGIDYLLTREDVDPTRIGAMGISQGGFLSLGLAGMDSRVTAVAAHVPFLCDVRHNAFFETDAGSDTYWTMWNVAPDRNLREVFGCFDPVNLAHRMTMPVIVSSGGQDVICPPPTIQAVFERLAGIRSLVHFPALPHTSSSEFFAMAWDWMHTYVKDR